MGPERTDGERVGNISQPALTVYPASVDRPARTAVVICPGGGYEYLSFTREGHQYAQWLSSLGVTAFVLKSRLSGCGHPATTMRLNAGFMRFFSSAARLCPARCTGYGRASH